jgi:hypothetical protein
MVSRIGGGGVSELASVHQWLLDLLVNLFVPALVWALSITGLVWVVQATVQEDERLLRERKGYDGSSDLG